jgi:hypothetical protein
VKAWPSLSQEIRSAVMAIIRSATLVTGQERING